jgi:hypothetical protein
MSKRLGQDNVSVDDNVREKVVTCWDRSEAESVLGGRGSNPHAAGQLLVSTQATTFLGPHRVSFVLHTFNVVKLGNAAPTAMDNGNDPKRQLLLRTSIRRLVNPRDEPLGSLASPAHEGGNTPYNRLFLRNRKRSIDNRLHAAGKVPVN